MKKVALCLALVFAVAVGTANAWNILMKDVNYTPCLEVSLSYGNVITGQATLEGNPSFPAPITGYVHGGKAIFTVSYLMEGGIRGYEINLVGRDGTTWGIYNADASFYDPPHSAHLDPCPPAAQVGPSGALY